MARAVDRRARVGEVTVDGDRVVIDVAVVANAAPASEPPEVALVRLSGAVSWVFDPGAGTTT
jgi:hypothetical protein